MNMAILMSLSIPWARETALRLASLGHDVHVIDFAEPLENGAYLRRNDKFQAESIAALYAGVKGVHLIKTPFTNTLRYFTSRTALRRIFAETRAEVLLTLYGGGFGTMAHLSGIRPYAIYAVGSDILLQTGIRRQISSWALSSADVVFVNGQYLTEQSRQMAPHARLEPLLLGIDTERFTPGTPASTPVHIVCTRGFSPVYNNEFIIQAMAQLPDDLPDFTFTFASAGPQLEAARALADSLLPAKTRSRVAFLGGVSSECLLDLLQNAHIYTSVSRSDGTSTSLLEAMACGLYPILSDLPQNREWISEDLDNGALVPLDDVETLARTMADAIRRTDHGQRAAPLNRQLAVTRASNKINMSTLAHRVEQLAHVDRKESPTYVY